ncbi:alanine racemase [Burkholderia cenocepacia]
MSRPLSADIDLNALRHNLIVARMAMNTSRKIAVVKTDAYSHGIGNVVSAFDEVNLFAVLSVEEALKRRSPTDKKFVLLEGLFSRSEMEVIECKGFLPVLHSREPVEWVLAEVRWSILVVRIPG